MAIVINASVAIDAHLARMISTPTASEMSAHFLSTVTTGVPSERPSARQARSPSDRPFDSRRVAQGPGQVGQPLIERADHQPEPGEKLLRFDARQSAVGQLRGYLREVHRRYDARFIVGLDDARAGLVEQRRQDGGRVKNGLAHRRIPTAPPLRDPRSTPRRPASFLPAPTRQAVPALV